MSLKKIKSTKVFLIAISVMLFATNVEASLDTAKSAYTNGDFLTASREFKVLADEGIAEAQNKLGWMYTEAEGLPKDYNKAVRLYRQAADQGNADAMYNLGQMYLNGYGVTTSAAEEKKWYRLASQHGHGHASYFLGLYQLASDQGDKWAQSWLGGKFFEGDGVPQNYSESLRYYRLAAEQGDSNAKYFIGEIYRNGYGVQQNYDEAVKWFLLAANPGASCREANSLGQMYEHGEGVPQDYIKAINWYVSGAFHCGGAYGSNSLARMFADGKGVQQDDKEASKWYRISANNVSAYNWKEMDKLIPLLAESSSKNSYFILGQMYENGYGITKDLKKALSWYRRAADKGNIDSLESLASVYKYGQYESFGASKNLIVTYAFDTLLMRVNPNESNYSLKQILPEMTSQDIEEGQLLVREMAKPNNLLKALDRYVRQVAKKPASKISSSKKDIPSSESNDKYPSKPAKVNGLTSCNTVCENSSCYRTYDNGKKVRFQAKQVWDALEGQFKYDSGGC